MSTRPHAVECLCSVCAQWYKDQYARLMNDRLFDTSLRIYLKDRDPDFHDQSKQMKEAMVSAYRFAEIFNNG